MIEMNSILSRVNDAGSPEEERRGAVEERIEEERGGVEEV